MAQGWRGSYYRYKGFFLNIVELYKKRADLRMFLEIILSLSTIIIFTVFALKPTAVTIIELVKEIENKKATVVTLDKKIGDLEIAQEVYSRNQNILSAINSSVPNSPEPQIFSSQVESLSRNNSVNILGVSIGEAVLQGLEDKKAVSSELKPFPQNARELTVSISVSGNYQNLVSFIQSLEKNIRPIKMDIVGFNTTQNDLEQVISVIISGRIPYLGDTEQKQ